MKQLRFRSTTGAGFSPEVSSDPRHIRAVKLPAPVQVIFANRDQTINTREGPVSARAGDAILTGNEGEQWPVSRERFLKTYEPSPPLTTGEPGRYIRRPMDVLAVKIDQPFTVVLRDGVSELHGVAGDWLVDYGDGSFGVVSDSIFASTYRAS